MFLVTLDVTGIQTYVFGSNRVPDNIGASALVDQAMRSWTVECARAAGLCPKEGPIPADGWLGAFHEGAVGVRGAFIRRTGGGAQLVARDEKDALGFVSGISERILRDATGLRLVAVVTEWSFGEPYSKANDEAQRLLASRKSSRDCIRHPDLPGVVERCVVTGEPASLTVDGDRVSLDVAQRRAATDAEGRGGRFGLRGLAGRSQAAGKSELSRALRRVEQEGLEVVGNFDLMRGEKHHTSYLAVVHIDANGMGPAFQEVARSGTPGDRALESAARDVDAAVGPALAAAIDFLCDQVEVDKGGRPSLHDGQVPLYSSRAPYGRTQKPWALPFRPIVGAGDDLTFVCEGTVGLHVGRLVAEKFAAELQSLSGFKDVGACCGIGFGLAHAPFSQLYALAEGACKAGKDRAREARSRGQQGTSWLAYRFFGEHALPATNAVKAFQIGGTGASGALDDWSRFEADWLMPCVDHANEHRAQLKGLLGDILQNDGRDAVRMDRWEQRKLPIGRLFKAIVDRYGTDRRTWPADPRINALELMDFVYRPKPGNGKEDQSNG